eukprot:GHRR01024093.1.p1 GENE.GHRR01024093.1~~GHRR01024093.1.p1  ORF type:complete len:125 (-),score=25.73 GHRR01024093.1:365-739(-)
MSADDICCTCVALSFKNPHMHSNILLSVHMTYELQPSCHAVYAQHAGMGGAYLTLLNTIANMGVILPKTPLFAAMDWLTHSNCRDVSGRMLAELACPKKLRLLAEDNACTKAGATLLWHLHQCW